LKIPPPEPMMKLLVEMDTFGLNLELTDLTVDLD
jgi:hypothetical protein